MARRSFDVVDVTEILIHWHAGRSISEVSTSLGVDRKTIRYAGSGISNSWGIHLTDVQSVHVVRIQGPTDVRSGLSTVDR
jgi:hypothetical protein